jgi:lipoprotein-anchoring transpeptidase ErfK/SrfK
MPEISRRVMLAGFAAMPLAGCVVAPPPEVTPLDYAARRDGRFTVPAVPIDQIPEGLRRQIVPFVTERPVGSIVIYPDQRSLHLVLENGYALRYGIAVGREGLGWTGEAEVYRKTHWPSWTPTENMIARDPSLEQWADGQPGGPSNPLGARALYLRTISNGRDEGIRIHGTPSWRSIGRAASSGCFRMINHDVIDLYDQVPEGTRVLVTNTPVTV